MSTVVGVNIFDSKDMETVLMVVMKIGSLDSGDWLYETVDGKHRGVTSHKALNAGVYKRCLGLTPYDLEGRVRKP